MAKDSSNIRIYGGLGGGAWCAPVGSTGPTTLAEPIAPFEEIGWISDAGVKLEQSADKQEFFAWQGGSLVKVSVSKASRTVTVECLEETATVLGLVHPGLTFTTTTGVAKGTVPGGISAVEKAWVFDAVDDSTTPAVVKRYVCPRGAVDPSATVEHKFDDMTIYQLKISIIGDFDIITNSPAIVTV